MFFNVLQLVLHKKRMKEGIVLQKISKQPKARLAGIEINPFPNGAFLSLICFDGIFLCCAVCHVNMVVGLALEKYEACVHVRQDQCQWSLFW